MKKSIKSDIVHEGILAFGCGCNKGKIASAVSAVTRTTIYQVIGSDQSVVGEFASLPEARTKAVEVSGRVKVTSKAV